MADKKPGTFTKNDPRINRHGRPKNFDALRTLAQQIAHEEVKDSAGNPALIDGHKVTKTELILRQWAQSKDPRQQQMFVEICYGKVPTVTEVTGANGTDLSIVIKYADADGDAT